MQSYELAILNPMDVKLIVAVMAAWTVLLCLKILGHSYLTAVRCHDLKVKSLKLRIKFDRELNGSHPEPPVTGPEPHQSVVDPADSVSRAA